jgi:hypothetical protein
MAGAPVVSRYNDAVRERAIERGIDALGEIARDPRYSAEYGTDLLWCLYSFSEVARDAGVREKTGEMAHELAAQWMKSHASLPENAGPDDLVDYATGIYAAAHLGFQTGAIRKQMKKRAAEIPVTKYYGFDPRYEPPPEGANRYDVWCDALITAQAGEIAGVKLGAAFAEVIRWLPRMRPYPDPKKDPRFYPVLYSITHAIYTINNYSVYAVERECLRPEFDYLRANVQEAIERNDPETMGEFLDTLRAFGMTDRDPEIRRGVAFLLATQNEDGTWGNPKDPDVYNRYHSTWTALDGLIEYRFKPARACPLFE